MESWKKDGKHKERTNEQYLMVNVHVHVLKQGLLYIERFSKEIKLLKSTDYVLKWSILLKPRRKGHANDTRNSFTWYKSKADEFLFEVYAFRHWH